MSSTLCPPCTKPSTLNADRKVQNRGNARARVFKVRLICPAVVTKTRGAEAISAAASSACAALRRAAACGILPHAHAKRKRKHSNHHWPPHYSDALGGAARASTAAATDVRKQRPQGECILRSVPLMAGGEARPEAPAGVASGARARSKAAGTSAGLGASVYGWTKRPSRPARRKIRARADGGKRTKASWLASSWM